VHSNSELSAVLSPPAFNPGRISGMLLRISMCLAMLAFIGCSDDDADSLGVGAQCALSEECDVDNGQACLQTFKGGYCGIEDCTDDLGCPDLSACVMHDDGQNYCFRTCTDKAQCNENRDVDNESNCSANITFVETQEGGVKACVPPSA
jgi:hypothetical protein